MGKLINRIPGWHLLISSLTGTALRTFVETQGLPSILYIPATNASETPSNRYTDKL